METLVSCIFMVVIIVVIVFSLENRNDLRPKERGDIETMIIIPSVSPSEKGRMPSTEEINNLGCLIISIKTRNVSSKELYKAMQAKLLEEDSFDAWISLFKNPN